MQKRAREVAARCLLRVQRLGVGVVVTAWASWAVAVREAELRLAFCVARVRRVRLRCVFRAWGSFQRLGSVARSAAARVEQLQGELRELERLRREGEAQAVRRADAARQQLLQAQVTS